VTAANGFATGRTTITASYGGSSTYTASSGTTHLTVTAPSFTLSTSSATTISLAAGATTTIPLTLSATGFDGPVSFNVTSSNASAVTGSAPAVTWTNNGNGTYTGSSTLLIVASQSAANHRPALPWKSGGALVLAAMLGVPWTLRERKTRKKALAILLTAMVLMMAGLAVSCGSSNSTPAGTQSFVLTVTPQPAGASALKITVNVP
jgi:hypothetical protein